MLYTGHGGGGSPLQFTPGNVDGVRVESKICELCTRTYIREVGSALVATCERCIARARLRLRQEERELEVARSYGGPQRAIFAPSRMMPEVRDGYPPHRARSDRALSNRAQ